MSIEVNGVTLPDIPSEVLEQYPYAVVKYDTVAAGIVEEYPDGGEIYTISCASEPLVFATAELTRFFASGLVPPTETTNMAIYTLEDGVWVLTSTDYSNLIILCGLDDFDGAMSASVVWANYDILTVTAFDTETKLPTAVSDEVYFPSSVSHPSEYSIPHDDVVFLADQTRRLTGATGSLGFAEIKSGLESVTQITLSELAVTANGTYTAGDGEGYNKVTVNVPAEAGDGLNFVSNATGCIPDYDHGYATSTLTLDDMFESTAVGEVTS